MAQQVAHRDTVTTRSRPSTPGSERFCDVAELALASVSDPADYRISLHNDLDSCAVAWRLFEQEAHATAFQQHAWLESWMRTVGAARGVEPCIVFVRDAGGQLVMILPLAVEKVLGFTTLVWMAQDEADYNAPLVRRGWDSKMTPAEVSRILRCVAESVPDVHAFRLMKTLTTVEDAPVALTWLKHSPHPSAGHSITLTGDDFDSYYMSVRSKSTRKRDRQRRRRLEESGTLAFTIAETPADQHVLLDRILTQKASWFEARGISNPFDDADVLASLHALIDSTAARQSLHVSGLMLDGQLLAGNFGYLRGDRFYAVIGSVTDGEAARHSPGTIHLHELMRWCYLSGIRAFDLTVGDEGYKKDWCDVRHELIDIRLPLSMAGLLLTLPCQIKGDLKRRIKASPRLYNAALSLRRFFRSLTPA